MFYVPLWLSATTAQDKPLHEKRKSILSGGQLTGNKIIVLVVLVVTEVTRKTTTIKQIYRHMLSVFFYNLCRKTVGNRMNAFRINKYRRAEIGNVPRGNIGAFFTREKSVFFFFVNKT